MISWLIAAIQSAIHLASHVTGFVSATVRSVKFRRMASEFLLEISVLVTVFPTLDMVISIRENEQRTTQTADMRAASAKALKNVAIWSGIAAIIAFAGAVIIAEEDSNASSDR